MKITNYLILLFQWKIQVLCIFSFLAAPHGEVLPSRLWDSKTSINHSSYEHEWLKISKRLRVLFWGGTKTCWYFCNALTPGWVFRDRNLLQANISHSESHSRSKYFLLCFKHVNFGSRKLCKVHKNNLLVTLWTFQTHVGTAVDINTRDLQIRETQPLPYHSKLSLTGHILSLFTAIQPFLLFWNRHRMGLPETPRTSSAAISKWLGQKIKFLFPHSR